MPTNAPSAHPNIAAFLRALSVTQPAYRCGRFSYVALLHSGDKIILRARLELLTEPTQTRERVATANLFAGETLVPIGRDSVETYVGCALATNYLPPVEEALLKLLPKGSGESLSGYSDYYERVDISSARDGHEYDRLVLGGTSRDLLVGAKFWLNCASLGTTTLTSLPVCMGWQVGVKRR